MFVCIWMAKRVSATKQRLPIARVDPHNQMTCLELDVAQGECTRAPSGGGCSNSFIQWNGNAISTALVRIVVPSEGESALKSICGKNAGANCCRNRLNSRHYRYSNAIAAIPKQSLKLDPLRSAFNGLGIPILYLYWCGMSLS